MYLPTQFSEQNVDVMHEFIRAHPLSTLVTLSSDGLNANHIPLHLSVEPAPFGTLRGHVARSNPVWSDIIKDVEVLAIFHGPGSYITPSWYPTKAETGKVVPTWNYSVVHAYGILRVIDDSSWLHANLEALTTHNEAPFSKPWHVSDAPTDYIENLMAAIVGIEFVITRLYGKWKTSQNQPTQNQAGVILGLRAIDNTEALRMADMVAKHHAP